MRALVQRVARASVTVAEEAVGRIEQGLVVLLGVGRGDEDEDARYVVDKVVNLRIFDDEAVPSDSGRAGRFNLSALDVGAQLLIVSQFTLYADTRKGRRPSFLGAAPPQEAEALLQKAVELFGKTGLKVETGRFQQRMQVSLQNDGPVTILIDSADGRRPRNG